MSGDAKVRLKAVDVLANIGSRTTREALVALLGDPNPDVRGCVVRAVGTGRVNESADTLREMLHDDGIAGTQPSMPASKAFFSPVNVSHTRTSPGIVTAISMAP